MLNNVRRQELGLRAMQHGAGDWYREDQWTNAGDTIANILHAVMPEYDEYGVDELFRDAHMHYKAEATGIEDE